MCKISWICGLGSDVLIEGWTYKRITKAGASTHQPINLSTNTRKIVKLCIDVCGYGYGCVNVNVADFAFANGNVAGCVKICMKKFSVFIDKAK